MSVPEVVIIELGSQYTLLIQRSLRELGVRSVVFDPVGAQKWLGKHIPSAVILSGGAASVCDKDAPQPPKSILSLKRIDGRPVPILGICYGMQWLAQKLGGEVHSSLGHKEYGSAKIQFIGPSNDPVFAGPLVQEVWMSHGDTVTKVPPGFQVLAVGRWSSKERLCPPVMMTDGSRWGVQFHPEVTHTVHGKEMLENFLHSAGCKKDWVPRSLIAQIQDHAQREIGNRRAIFGFSGGVDSTTMLAILAPILKDRLLALTVDAGQLREGEVEEIRVHAQAVGATLRVMDVRQEFQEALSGAVDAEEKRNLFKQAYSHCFVRAAKEFGAAVVLQGTLAPDRIESGVTGGVLIKSHHNIGLDMGDLTQIHPIDHLFKYEIRALAQEIGLPESVSKRQPFPGPGLFVRIIGVPATLEKLAVVRWADARVREILIRHGKYNQLSQLVVAYVGVNTVGVKGDARVYGGAIVVRAVDTVDFMTAEGVHFSDEVEKDISSELTRHPDIVRVWYDPTKKPPATTELE
ncbi:MAG: glutamine-hydrolyzing GMP synthase [Patescibacteria group bacterium]